MIGIFQAFELVTYTRALSAACRDSEGMNAAHLVRIWLQQKTWAFSKLGHKRSLVTYLL